MRSSYGPVDDGVASIRQKTLKSSISCSGIGLHSGQRIAMTLHPADVGTGISFHRTDVAADEADIPASWRNVVDNRLATTLGNKAGTRISTVEHLMAALAGCGIDNAVIDIDGPEVPVMDGSAAPFIFLIECAGVVEQAAPRLAIRIDRPISVGDENRFVSARPDKTFNISFEIDFEHAAVARQSLSIRLVNGTFKTEIARARTFGFADEIDALRKAGLARGGSLDNAVVISGGKVLNDGGLRYSDEFVRHKILDCVGDLYLAGGPIIGRIDALRSGHRLNHRLLSKLFADDEAWSWVEITDMVVPGAPFGWDLEAQLAIA